MKFPSFHTLTRILLLPVLGISSPTIQAETLELRTLQLDKKPMPELYVHGSEEPQRLKFSSLQPSAAIAVGKTDSLLLYRQNEGGSKAIQKAYQVDLPDGAKGVLLLAWKAADKERFLAVEDHYSEAKDNRWLIINAADRAIAFQVGANTKPAVIKPNSIHVFDLEAPQGEGAAVMAKASFDQEVKTIYSTYWPIHAGKRMVVVITNSGEKVNVKPIFDCIPTRKNEESE